MIGRNVCNREGHVREKGVEDPLSSQERVISPLLLADRSGGSDRPDLVERVLGGLALELGLKNDVLTIYKEGPRRKFRVGSHVRHGTKR